MHFESRGTCSYGARCAFAHGKTELQRKGQALKEHAASRSKEPGNLGASAPGISGTPGHVSPLSSRGGSSHASNSVMEGTPLASNPVVSSAAVTGASASSGGGSGGRNTGRGHSGALPAGSDRSSGGRLSAENGGARAAEGSLGAGWSVEAARLGGGWEDPAPPRSQGDPAVSQAGPAPAAPSGGEREERRRDAHDGQLYTADEFVSYYGSLAEWHVAAAGAGAEGFPAAASAPAAAAPPAEPGPPPGLSTGVSALAIAEPGPPPPSAAPAKTAGLPPRFGLGPAPFGQPPVPVEASAAPMAAGAETLFSAPFAHLASSGLGDAGLGDGLFGGLDGRFGGLDTGLGFGDGFGAGDGFNGETFGANLSGGLGVDLSSGLESGAGGCGGLGGVGGALSADGGGLGAGGGGLGAGGEDVVLRRLGLGRFASSEVSYQLGTFFWVVGATANLVYFPSVRWTLRPLPFRCPLTTSGVEAAVVYRSLQLRAAALTPTVHLFLVVYTATYEVHAGFRS